MRKKREKILLKFLTSELEFAKERFLNKKFEEENFNQKIKKIE